MVMGDVARWFRMEYLHSYNQIHNRRLILTNLKNLTLLVVMSAVDWWKSV